MLRTGTLILALAFAVFGQGGRGGPSGQGQSNWRRPLQQFPANAPAGTTRQDVERLESEVLRAAPYFSALTPGDYEANRDLVRRMVGYLAGVEMMNRDPAMRQSINRAYIAIAGLRWMYPSGQMSPGGGESTSPQQPRPAGPPFAMQAPTIEDVPPKDRATADDLSSRYEGAAATAATAWQSSETLRRSLESRGMALNAETSASTARLQLYFDLAADALRSRDWAEAKTNLQRAEGETEKIFRVVGR